MRVLLTTISHYQDLPSGSAKVVYDESLELARLGHEVYVLGPTTADLPEHEISGGIHLLRYRAAKSLGPSRASSHSDPAVRLLRKYLPRVDALHGHAHLPSLAAMRFYGNSVSPVSTIHSPAPLEMKIVWRDAAWHRRLAAPIGLHVLARIEREILRRSRVTTVLSQFTAESLRKIHGAPLTQNVKVIPGWTDLSRFRPALDRVQAKLALGWPAETPVFFTLRRLVPRMGIDRLLQAANLVKRDGFDFRLVIGGNGPLRAALEAQAHASGLQDVVQFLGRVSENDLPRFYAACDAFVLPTAELECFGLIVIEALASGRPVLATPVGAIPEILTQIEPAWLARSASAAHIAALLANFLRQELPSHSPAELHRFVQRGYNSHLRIAELAEMVVGSRGNAAPPSVTTVSPLRVQQR